MRTPEYEVPVGLFVYPIRAEYYCATTRSIARRSGLLCQGEVLSPDWSCAGVHVTEETSYRAGGWARPPTQIARSSRRKSNWETVIALSRPTAKSSATASRLMAAGPAPARTAARIAAAVGSSSTGGACCIASPKLRRSATVSELRMPARGSRVTSNVCADYRDPAGCSSEVGVIAAIWPPSTVMSTARRRLLSRTSTTVVPRRIARSPVISWLYPSSSQPKVDRSDQSGGVGVIDPM